MNYLLPVLVLLPLLAGIALAVWGQRLRSAAVSLGVVTGLVNLALAAVAAFAVFSSRTPTAEGAISPRILFAPDWFSFDFPFVIRGHLTHVQLALGLDGISALMLLLTAIIVFAVITAASRQIADRLAAYNGLVLVTAALLNGVFLAMDLLTFYICFEAVLLPVVLLIAMWGERGSAGRAATRFLLFTLAGSIPMVVGLIGLMTYSADLGAPPVVRLDQVAERITAIDRQSAAAAAAEAVGGVSTARYQHNLEWILATLLFGFGIKMAIVPLHAWLPVTYISSHPNTTALIAAVVGKLGLYGIIRLVLTMMPDTMDVWGRYLFATLGSIAIVYGALAALAQRDPRGMFAYSSISHLGFITIGLMSYSQIGIEGAVLQMFNHGVIVAAIFLLIASAEQRYGRREISERYQGLASTSPGIAALFIFFLLASAGLPGLNSFVGELMTLSGLMQYSVGLAAVSVTGVLLGAWYALRFVQRMLFGEPRSTHHTEIPARLSLAERSALLPLAGVCLLIGLLPMTAIRLFDREAAELSTRAISDIELAANIEIQR